MYAHDVLMIMIPTMFVVINGESWTLPLSEKGTTWNETLDMKAVGVVVVDVWNSGNCKTSSNRLEASLDLMNNVLNEMRGAGSTVLWAPSDVVPAYSGFPQRERAFWTPREAFFSKECVIHQNCTRIFDDIDYTPVPWQYAYDSCSCGHHPVPTNPAKIDVYSTPGMDDSMVYGWGKMSPLLRIAEEDYIVDGTDDHNIDESSELYSICRERGLTTLLYLGTSTQVCVLHKPIGMMTMSSLGLRTILTSDMTEPVGRYRPSTGFTPDDTQRAAVEWLETNLFPSTSIYELLVINNRWPTSPQDRVMIHPWGSENWPHYYVHADGVPVTFTLLSGRWSDSSAHGPGVDIAIRYTEDGTIPENDTGTEYRGTFTTRSQEIRAAAFDRRTGQRVTSKDSLAVYVSWTGSDVCNVSAEIEENGTREAKCQADVLFSEISTTHVRGTATYYRNRKGHTVDKPWSGHGRLHMFGINFEGGIGVMAPYSLVYDLSEYPSEIRRVAFYVGVDRLSLIADKRFHNGWSIAGLALIRLQVWIDGVLFHTSPNIRLQMAPWAVDLPVPHGSKLMRIVATGVNGVDDSSYAYNYVDIAGGLFFDNGVGEDCDASVTYAHGDAGDCGSALHHGGTCQPSCAEGFEASGKTYCQNGRLTRARCITPPTKPSSENDVDALRRLQEDLNISKHQIKKLTGMTEIQLMENDRLRSNVSVLTDIALEQRLRSERLQKELDKSNDQVQQLMDMAEQRRLQRSRPQSKSRTFGVLFYVLAVLAVSVVMIAMSALLALVSRKCLRS